LKLEHSIAINDCANKAADLPRKVIAFFTTGGRLYNSLSSLTLQPAAVCIAKWNCRRFHLLVQPAMSKSMAFAELLELLRNRDPQGLAYLKRLVAIAWRRLSSRVRQKVDPEEVVNSVFRSFLRREAAGVSPLQDGQDLWLSLAELTHVKCSKLNRHFLGTKGFNAALEVPLQHSTQGGEHGHEPVAYASAPEAPVIMADYLEALLHDLPEEQKKLAELLLGDCSVRQIAEEFGWSERTTGRRKKEVLERIIRWLEKRRQSEDGLVT
jgi:RNA polymerase sigma-70 factor (ECF subfamily)